jgi:hypothetical protein
LGPAVPGSFTSEFGASVFSSFESMAPTLDPSDWSAHAPVMRQRNYPADNYVEVRRCTYIHVSVIILYVEVRCIQACLCYYAILYLTCGVPQ